MERPILRELNPIDPARAEGAQKQVLDRAKAQVGFIPNMYANMANAPAVLDTYLHGYGLFRSESGFTPPEQEVVFLAVSAVNECSYCMAAHSMIADKMSRVPAETLAAIRAGQAIPDARLAALHRITTEMARTRGQPAPEAVQAFLDAGFDEQKLLYIVLALAVKTLSNFTNHLFGTELDERFAGYRIGQREPASA